MVKETYTKSPVKTTKIHPEFTDAYLTNYGGLIPFADFLLQKLSFPQILAEQLDLGMGPNCSYRDWQVFGLIVFGYLCGYTRLAHFEYYDFVKPFLLILHTFFSSCGCGWDRIRFARSTSYNTGE